MDENLQRYSRQIFFEGFGEAAQRRLMDGTAVVLGCGALGTVSASSLARAGVGRLRIVDRDFIEENNLQRQILFNEEDIREGVPKAEAARRKLSKVNSKIEIEGIVSDINYTNIEQLIKDADVVLDATDNFETRFLINDACVKLGIPWIYGACIGSNGLTMTIRPGQTPCLRCIYEEIPPPDMSPSCDTAGVLNTIVNVIASLQANEALKLLTGQPERLRGDVLYVDLWSDTYKRLHEREDPNPECPTCNGKKFEFLEGRSGSQTTSLCGRNSVQVTQRNKVPVNFQALEEKLRKLGPVTHNKFMLKFEIQDKTFTVFPDGRAIIQGTHDESVARNLYAKYVGS
jgi:adenylyltransferase/sulfurtransferase